MTVDKRRIDACLKACEGISTQNLEDNVPFLELARRYNDVLRERDALRAKVEQMEQQKPVVHVWRCDNGHIHGSCERELPMGQQLYALPGAKGEKDV